MKEISDLDLAIANDVGFRYCDCPCNFTSKCYRECTCECTCQFDAEEAMILRDYGYKFQQVGLIVSAEQIASKLRRHSKRYRQLQYPKKKDCAAAVHTSREELRQKQLQRLYHGLQLELMRWRSHK